MILKKLLKPFEDKRKVYEFLVGLSLLLVMTGAAYTRWLDPLEYLFLDLRFQLRPPIPFPKDVAIIGVDESSLDVLGRWPWPRDKHAALLGLLRQDSFRPAVIGYDALFENRNQSAPEGDEALAYQTQNFKGHVVMSYFFEKGPASLYERDEVKEKVLEKFALRDSESFAGNLDHADKVSLPYLELAEVSDLAFVNTPVDRDGRTRRVQLLMRYQDKTYPSMDFLAVLRYLDVDFKEVKFEDGAIVIEKSKAGRRVIPVSGKGEMLINYYGSTTAIPSYSFIQILESGKIWMNGQSPKLLESLKNKIVLVGVTALGIGDRRTTPFRQYEPGVNLHAQVIANILEENFLSRAPAWLSFTALLITGIIVILITMFLRITYSLPDVIGIAVGYFLISVILFWRGLWIDVAIQEVTMATLFIGISSFRYFMTLEELKRTQEQLIQSTKMASLGQLSAGIAHEFRNILNAIGLHVEYCSLPGTPPERMVKYMGVIKEIMTNANLILNGLLTFARKSESVKKPGNLKKTVEDTLLLVQKSMMSHQIEVKTELEEVPEIAYDAGQISQVVMNLMNNGRDALQDREGKQITLRVKNDPRGVLLEIADNGSGIPPQVLKRLFEPFVTSKPAGKGTGLGLSVCHGIVRNHGGEITVTTGQGKGTTWHILLPKT